MHHLATVRYNQGRYDEEAEVLCDETFERSKVVVLGEDHPDTLRTMNGLAYFRFGFGSTRQVVPTIKPNKLCWRPSVLIGETTQGHALLAKIVTPLPSTRRCIAWRPPSSEIKARSLDRARRDLFELCCLERRTTHRPRHGSPGHAIDDPRVGVAPWRSRRR
jgi:hypothetical protein